MRKLTNAVVVLALLATLSACNKTDGNVNSNTATGGSSAATSGQTQVGGSTTTAVATNYSLREGDSYYYEGAGVTTLTEVIDAGWTKDKDGDFVRVLVSEGVKVTFKAGSAIVRVVTVVTFNNGMTMDGDSSALPLYGDSIAALAMQDAINGVLTHPGAPPTEAEYEESVKVAAEERRERINKFYADQSAHEEAARLEAMAAADAAEAATN